MLFDSVDDAFIDAHMEACGNSGDGGDDDDEFDLDEAERTELLLRMESALLNDSDAVERAALDAATERDLRLEAAFTASLVRSRTFSQS